MKTNAPKFQTIVCLRCGRGFMLTSSYLDLLKRRGAKVVAPVLCPTCFLAEKPLKHHPLPTTQLWLWSRASRSWPSGICVMAW